ncbi:hypothetical protein [Bradyrhizobium sp. 2TAF24]|uniref:hypothetical protein n=1 Tax=Bradyrhizobium sp. 2TAF24 TaxID=3233011 RepID=UPI003F901F1C
MRFLKDLDNCEVSYEIREALDFRAARRSKRVVTDGVRYAVGNFHMLAAGAAVATVKRPHLPDLGLSNGCFTGSDFMVGMSAGRSG